MGPVAVAKTCPKLVLPSDFVNGAGKKLEEKKKKPWNLGRKQIRNWQKILSGSERMLEEIGKALKASWKKYGKILEEPQ